MGRRATGGLPVPGTHWLRPHADTYPSESSPRKQVGHGQKGVLASRAVAFLLPGSWEVRGMYVCEQARELVWRGPVKSFPKSKAARLCVR